VSGLRERATYAESRRTVNTKNTVHNWLPKSILKQLAIQIKKYVDETLPSSVIFDGKSNAQPVSLFFRC